jgi:hypothetical protein
MFKLFIAAFWLIAIIFLMWSYNAPTTEVFACSDLPNNTPADVRNLCKLKLK